jgi:DivIVA domain-containing protein
VVTFLTYLFGLAVASGLLFLLASFAFGRGEELAAMPPDGTPVELPDGRPVRGDDVRELRLSVVLRGYRMAEVDWVLDRLACQLDHRDQEIARLRAAAGSLRSTAGLDVDRSDAPPDADALH